MVQKTNQKQIKSLTRHFLVFEDSSWVLSAARRAGHAVRQGVSVRRAASREAPSLHDALETLSFCDATNVDELGGRRNK